MRGPERPETAGSRPSISVTSFRIHQLLKKRDGAGFPLGADGREENTFSPGHGCSAGGILHVELRAFFDEELYDVVGSPVGCSHDRGQAHRVHGIYIAAFFQTEPNRF